MSRRRPTKKGLKATYAMLDAAFGPRKTDRPRKDEAAGEAETMLAAARKARTG